MPAISNDWLTPLSQEFRKPYYKKLYETILEEYKKGPVFPPADDIFNAFHLTPLSDVKVVILGQDPYHNYNQAHGLCFSVRPEVEIPPSLVNIYKELQDDLGCYIPNNGYLVNPKAIRTVKGYDITLINDQIIPISHPRRKEVLEQLNLWLGGGNT